MLFRYILDGCFPRTNDDTCALYSPATLHFTTTRIRMHDENAGNA
jgi:hypothetical protein